jgi:hypothetical protein
LAGSVSHPAYGMYEQHLHQTLEKYVRVMESTDSVEAIYRAQGAIRCLRQLINLKENVLADIKREKNG